MSQLEANAVYEQAKYNELAQTRASEHTRLKGELEARIEEQVQHTKYELSEKLVIETQTRNAQLSRLEEQYRNDQQQAREIFQSELIRLEASVESRLNAEAEERKQAVSALETDFDTFCADANEKMKRLSTDLKTTRFSVEQKLIDLNARVDDHVRTSKEHRELVLSQLADFDRRVKALDDSFDAKVQNTQRTIDSRVVEIKHDIGAVRLELDHVSASACVEEALIPIICSQEATRTARAIQLTEEKIEAARQTVRSECDTKVQALDSSTQVRAYL
jgi:hypothetical protein